MAFVQINKSRVVIASGQEPLVTMGTYLADGKAHKGRSISFRLTYPLFVQLGWEIKDRKIGIGINEGVGEDAGFLQLIHDEAHGYRGSQGSATRSREYQGVTISVTYERFKHYVLNECPVSAHLVNHMVDNNTLIVECPDWLRFNPQSVPEQQQQQPKLEDRLPLSRRVNQETNAEDKTPASYLNREERRRQERDVVRRQRHK